MKKSIKDLGDIKGKTALVRVDVNVPLDENKNVTDDTRIQAIVPTVKYLKDKGAKIVLMAHLGRPKGEKNPEFFKVSLHSAGSRKQKGRDSFRGGSAFLLSYAVVVVLWPRRKTSGKEKNVSEPVLIQDRVRIRTDWWFGLRCPEFPARMQCA